MNPCPTEDLVMHNPKHPDGIETQPPEPAPLLTEEAALAPTPADDIDWDRIAEDYAEGDTRTLSEKRRRLERRAARTRKDAA